MRLKDRIALITGAGRGIGEAIALRLAKEGAHVAIDDLDLLAAERVSNKIKKMGRSSIAIKADVRNKSEVEDMVKKTRDRLGRIDILVNNAGYSKVLPFLEVEEELWDFIQDVNLKSVYLCCHAVVSYMIEQGEGKIINISSHAGKTGGRWVTAYSAAKAGVIAFTQSLAWELAQYRINVNCVCPGVCSTQMWQSIKKQNARKLKVPVEKIDEVYAKEIPLGRLATPQDVANLVTFLASSEADYMTGQAVNITGGKEVH